MNLSQTNPHPRDALITKIRAGLYEHNNRKLVCVTTILKDIFPKFNADEVIKGIMTDEDKWNEDNKYWGMTPSQIKKMWKANGLVASADGTSLHDVIEKFLDKPGKTHADMLPSFATQTNVDPAFEEFSNFILDTPTVRPYRLEWKVGDEDAGIGGTIDAVYINDDGSVDIYDWKRKREISGRNFGKYAKCDGILSAFDGVPDSEYEKCKLQLNFYRCILQRKYGLKVKNMYLIRFYPEELYEPYQVGVSPEVELWFTKNSKPIH